MMSRNTRVINIQPPSVDATEEHKKTLKTGISNLNFLLLYLGDFSLNVVIKSVDNRSYVRPTT